MYLKKHGRFQGVGNVFAIVTVGAWAMSASAQSVLADSVDSTGNAAPQSAVSSAPAPQPSGAATSAPTGSSSGAASAMSANELAKQISNPVTDLWQLQFQFNNVKLESSNTPVSDKWVNNLYFQPVLPVKLTDNWNLITRPVFTLYNSVPVPTGPTSSRQTTTFGDTTLATVLSPARTEPWIFGVGPTFIFPTANGKATGQGKYQVGPAIGGGYITQAFMVAGFAQQWWSFAGDADRKATSQLSLLPLIYRFWGDGWSVGYSGNILADWKAQSGQRWTVPVGVSLGKVVWLGPLPVQIQLGAQSFVERPTGGPKWNIQLQLTPVIPRLITKTLFQ